MMTSTDWDRGVSQRKTLPERETTTRLIDNQEERHIKDLLRCNNSPNKSPTSTVEHCRPSEPLYPSWATVPYFPFWVIIAPILQSKGLLKPCHQHTFFLYTCTIGIKSCLGKSQGCTRTWVTGRRPKYHLSLRCHTVHLQLNRWEAKQWKFDHTFG